MLVNPGHPYFYLRHFKFMARRADRVLPYRQRSAQGAAARRGPTISPVAEFLDRQRRRVEIGADPIVAFSALGDNDRFADDMGRFRLAAFRGFPDHHAFQAGRPAGLGRTAQGKGRRLDGLHRKGFLQDKNFSSVPAVPLLYARNEIQLPGDAIEQIIHHAAEKGFI